MSPRFCGPIKWSRPSKISNICSTSSKGCLWWCLYYWTDYFRTIHFPMLVVFAVFLPRKWNGPSGGKRKFVLIFRRHGNLIFASCGRNLNLSIFRCAFYLLSCFANIKVHFTWFLLSILQYLTRALIFNITSRT